MGVSTDAILCYGIELDEENEVDFDDEDVRRALPEDISITTHCSCDCMKFI